MKAFFISFVFFLSSLSFGDCATVAGLERPKALPDYPHCTKEDQSGCKGWEVIGAPLEPEDIVIAPSRARLFLWESGKTLCLLFKRGEDVEGLNGIHCYNRFTCDVCAYDGSGLMMDKLQEGKTVKDDCSQCHVTGPILPRTKIWSSAFHLTQELNDICATRGGPKWIEAPPRWRQPDLKKRVSSPNSCKNCHSYFVKSGICLILSEALEGKDGSMLKYHFDLTTEVGRQECTKFSKEMSCVLKCSP